MECQVTGHAFGVNEALRPQGRQTRPDAFLPVRQTPERLKRVQDLDPTDRKATNQ
tara:strand:+ start:424 stop:588 length:165 start_codon:yes stop_codon:yes gene_type:complete